MKKKEISRELFGRELGRFVLDIDPIAFERIIDNVITKFDPEKLKRYEQIIEKRKDGPDIS